MTILFFVRLFYPHIGGVEKHVLEISKRLVKKGHRVMVVAEKHEGNLKDKERIEGIDVYRMRVGKNEWFKKFKIWIWLFKNINLIRKADIVHAHDVFFWYLPFKFIFPRKKVFTTFHGYENFPITKKAILVRKISEKLSLGNICIGNFISKWYKTKPTFVSYGGVNIIQNSEFRIQNSETPSAVFIGRLDEQTGFLTYLEAVNKIREKIPDFKFTVFGDGKFRNRIPPYVYFRGFVKDAEKEICKYNFVFASRYLSILEAMVAKRPVIAVYDNAIKEDYLKMSPFAKYIVITNSAQKITEEVISLLSYPDRSKIMVEKGFEWVKNQSWENVFKIYLKLWRKQDYA